MKDLLLLYLMVEIFLYRTKNITITPTVFCQVCRQRGYYPFVARSIYVTHIHFIRLSKKKTSERERIIL